MAYNTAQPFSLRRLRFERGVPLFFATLYADAYAAAAISCYARAYKMALLLRYVAAIRMFDTRAMPRRCQLLPCALSVSRAIAVTMLLCYDACYIHTLPLRYIRPR